MKKKVLVLGAGLVGKVMAEDLATSFEVTAADANEEALAYLKQKNIHTLKLDVTDTTRLQAAAKQADVVLGAVPGFLGYNTVAQIIESGKNMVDISFFPEDPFQLNQVAKNKGVTVVTDCGVAPGMGNIILGHHNATMNVTKYECLVGGLPAVRQWPYEYKAVFSPIDVIEEYTRPARYVQNGAVVVREALSDPELIFFDKVGTLEAWNSDGLRSLIQTMPHIPDMIEKTLRYPGCIEYLRVLRETGLFSHEPIEVKGVKIKPVDLLAKLLFPKWSLQPGEEEFTIMRILIEGEHNNQKQKITYTLLDRTREGVLSMARTTGYTATAALHLVADEDFKQPGINPPEFLGKSESNYTFILNYLAERAVVYTKHVQIAG
ncbi:MAG: saccharopine dehydrogenase NADP-binding domain-containing protein [Cyclobacteriaceae bacterium]|jgi:lysine 6-dehydrogenase|nr:saccharopine dehydrogenase NADP-binding domain-containing protein [Cytophagales bacterium]MCZ8327165.1 saccharopine dehydrogenase NADP-binding domain-containing protein [Cyclobacteriaceae bacterium]